MASCAHSVAIQQLSKDSAQFKYWCSVVLSQVNPSLGANIKPPMCLLQEEVFSKGFSSLGAGIKELTGTEWLCESEKRRLVEFKGADHLYLSGVCVPGYQWKIQDTEAILGRLDVWVLQLLCLYHWQVSGLTFGFTRNQGCWQWIWEYVVKLNEITWFPLHGFSDWWIILPSYKKPTICSASVLLWYKVMDLFGNACRLWQHIFISSGCDCVSQPAG